LADDPTLLIEKLGGLAGLGLPGSRLISIGELSLAKLSSDDLDAVRSLFAEPPSGAVNPDAFRFRMTLVTSGKSETIEVGENHLPASIRRIPMVAPRQQ
jgi:hypothetical protein